MRATNETHSSSASVCGPRVAFKMSSSSLGPQRCWVRVPVRGVIEVVIPNDSIDIYILPTNYYQGILLSISVLLTNSAIMIYTFVASIQNYP